MRGCQDDPRYERLRVLLKQERERRGLTQLELGKRLDRDQLFVSRFESGRRQINVIEFLDIARGIGVDPIRLLRKLEADSPAS